MEPMVVNSRDYVKGLKYIIPKKRRVESRVHPFSGELYEFDITPPEIEVKLSLDDAQRLADTLWTCGIHPRQTKW